MSCPYTGSYENNFARFPGLKSVPAGETYSVVPRFPACAMVHEGIEEKSSFVRPMPLRGYSNWSLLASGLESKEK